MKVFIDLHHGDLYYAMHLLFEKRLGFELYRPIGLDWFHEGFWGIGNPYPDPLDTAKAYLDISKEGWKQYININGDPYIQNGTHYVYEPFHEYYQKAITLEKFKQMKFDLIVATFPTHDQTYTKLKNLYQPQAKLIAQLGNVNQTTCIPNVIHSVPYKGKQPNVVFAHQEIDLNHYKYIKPNNSTKKIYSVVNCAPYLDTFHIYKVALPEIEMKYYGASCPDGSLEGSKAVGQKMQEANIGWHLKPLGGIGHSTMGWFASGRPVITNMSQHRLYGGDALQLFEPGVTCYDIETHTQEQNISNIRKLIQPEINNILAQNAYKRFHEVINYNHEEKLVRKFLERLI